MKLTVHTEGVCMGWDPETVLRLPDQLIDTFSDLLGEMQKQYAEAQQRAMSQARR